MPSWLLKTEPDDYTFDDLRRDRRTRWDRITNTTALKHLREVQVGDEALIYHTGDERRCVGLATVVKGPYPDPAGADPRHVVIDLKVVRALPQPVPLAAIKADPAFASFGLVRNSRLSVVPVSPRLWTRLLALGGAAELPSE